MKRVESRVGGRGRVSDYTRQELTRMITDRSLEPGDVLPSESRLAEGLGVSKPTVREALRQLSAMGAVEIRHGKQSVVRAPTSEPLEGFLKLAVRGTDGGLREAVELRRTLETEIAAIAAARISEDEVAELGTVVSEMRRNAETFEPWVDADVRFHVLIAKSTKNSLMLYLIEALGGLLRNTIGTLHAQRHVRNSEATLMRHVRIFEALEARDPGAAREAMRSHFDATEPVIRDIMGGGAQGERG